MKTTFNKPECSIRELTKTSLYNFPPFVFPIRGYTRRSRHAETGEEKWGRMTLPSHEAPTRPDGRPVCSFETLRQNFNHARDIYITSSPCMFFSSGAHTVGRKGACHVIMADPGAAPTPPWLCVVVGLRRQDLHFACTQQVNSAHPAHLRRGMWKTGQTWYQRHHIWKGAINN